MDAYRFPLITELSELRSRLKINNRLRNRMKNLTVPQKDPPRVALVSSTRAVFGPMEAAFREGFPEAQILNLLDETLVEDFRREGGLSPHSRHKALQMALTAQEAGVDGILVTCSTLSPCVDDLRPFVKVPIVKIDEPVIEEVLGLRRRSAFWQRQRLS